MAGGRIGEDTSAFSRDGMPAVFVALLLLSSLLQGCVTLPTQTYFEQKEEELVAGLQSYMGRNKDDLIMELASPAEKVTVNDGEIWIYKFHRTGSTTRATGTGSGALLNPYEEERKTTDFNYDLEIKLRFDTAGVAQRYSYEGHLAAFDTQFHRQGRQSLQKK
jgi:outer membrane lipoprotein-sorting protein